jgi:methyl-accepting chemotaxis protein
MKFFYNLKFSHKMLLLGLLMIVAIAAPTWHLQKRLVEALQFTEQEISGQPFADQILQLMALVHQHRAMTQYQLQGTDSTDIEGVSASVTKVINDLEMQAQGLPDNNEIIKKLDVIARKWSELDAAVMGRQLDISRAFDQHSALTSNILALLPVALEKSGLAFDPTPASYHLIIAAYQDAPRLLEGVSKIRGSSMLWLSAVQQQQDAAAMLQHQQRLQLYLQAYIQPLADLSTHLDSAYQLEPKVFQSVHSQHQQLKAALVDYVQQTQRLFSTPATDTSAFDQRSQQLLDKYIQLNQSFSPLLLQLLQQRLASDYATLYQVLGQGLLLLLIMLSIAWLLVNNLTRSIEQAVATANAITTKHFDRAVASKQTDETGQLINALFQMNTSLQQAAQMAAELHQRSLADAEKAKLDAIKAEEDTRVRQALDGASTCVTIANTQGIVIYSNQALQQLMQLLEIRIRTVLPQFEAGKILGQHMDLFPLDYVERTKQGDLVSCNVSIAGLHLRLQQSSIRNNANELIGYVTEWVNRTAEVEAEVEIANIVSAAKAGQFDVRANPIGRNGFLHRMSVELNDLLAVSEQSLGDISQVLQAIADGDLTKRVERQYQGTFEQLKNGCNQTAEKLSLMLTEIASASSQINQAASEISRGNSDLSGRTEQQASNLEETASSMEELTQTVRQNSDNACKASDLATAARTVAEHGGQMIQQVVTTMQLINQSAQQIADIISVMDGIAFQTNILALNAAVEAARAGEQGRGFSVVAAEVRSLAQRSANSAKDIKALISASVSRIHTGNQQVEQSGATMQQIVSSIRSVEQLMREIANASSEQTAGLDEINRAVTQMDDMTQQNAALVEEAAAAAESLLQQAEQLDLQVNRFALKQQVSERRETAAPVRRKTAPSLHLVSPAEDSWQSF